MSFYKFPDWNKETASRGTSGGLDCIPGTISSRKECWSLGQAAQICGGLAVFGGIYKTKVWFLGSWFSDGHFD